MLHIYTLYHFVTGIVNDSTVQSFRCCLVSGGLLKGHKFRYGHFVFGNIKGLDKGIALNEYKFIILPSRFVLPAKE
jgi:hypothetical protein